MAILRGFPPPFMISPGIRLTPAELEYFLVASDFQFVNAGPRGFVFDVECRTGPQRLDPDTFKACYLTTRIVVPREGNTWEEGKIWLVWSPRKDHAERVMASARRCGVELREIGKQREAFYKRKNENMQKFKGKFQEASNKHKGRCYGDAFEKLMKEKLEVFANNPVPFGVPAQPDVSVKVIWRCPLSGIDHHVPMDKIKKIEAMTGSVRLSVTGTINIPTEE
jgi:hypothetical protein